MCPELSYCTSSYKQRLPITEAAYAGKWEIVRRIYDRNWFNYYGCHTWSFPMPPPPYAMSALNSEARHARDIKCIDLPTVLAHGTFDHLKPHDSPFSIFKEDLKGI